MRNKPPVFLYYIKILSLRCLARAHPELRAYIPLVSGPNTDLVYKGLLLRC